MLFNSASFIFAFLPACLVFFFLLARFSHSLALFFLTLASLFFYAQTNPRHLLILVPSIVINYLIGSALANAGMTDRRRWWLAASGIAANLACLFVFKYFGLFEHTINRFGVTNLNWTIELPLGISFYTFTQIAFLADAYQHKVREPQFVNYALFVSYFPHLVAGPILHHAEMMPQFSAKSTFQPQSENFAVGITVFLIGLFKKVALADSFAPHVHKVFDAAGQGASLSMLEGWSGALFYSLQIYLDFSGYSDMAIGLSLQFGVRLPLNFNSPYKAVNIIDFWRRWHMTLSRFLRDYLYIPLGGNRSGEARRLVNLMIVMLLGGLWHGALLTFVVWGGLHGLYLIINHLWQMLIGENRARSPLSLATGRVMTFLLVTFAWIFFRSPNLHVALHMAESALGWKAALVPAVMAGSNLPSTELAALAAVVLAVIWLAPNTQEIMSLYKPALEGRATTADAAPPTRLLWRPNFLFAVAVSCIAMVSLDLILFQSRVADFIYFQF
jgi:D-alanyl-lipoteichoic acid acyltransferase DltB (MBOAT superfamily)